MFATLFSVTLLVALVRTVFAQSGLTIDTPAFVQCQDAQITWTASVAPYDIVIVPADDPCGDAIEDLGSQNSLAATFNVNIAAGTQVVLYIEDADGNEAWSGTVTVGGSNDASCLPPPPSAAAPAPSVSSPSVPSASAPSVRASAAPTTLSVPPQGGSHPAAAASPSSSPFAPAGAANAGILPGNGAPSTRPLSTVAIVAALLAAVAFAF